MATARILLPIQAATLPDGSGTGNNPARPNKVVSSGGQASNGPKVSYYQLLFSAGTDEHAMWTFQCPGDYSSGGVFRFTWGATVTTGNVKWKGGAAIGVVSSTDLDASSFLATVSSSAVAVPSTVGRFAESTLTPTLTGLAVGTMVTLWLGRDANDAADTAAGDSWITTASFEYTAL